ncbi:hypothetical protein [uncultured Psychrobacter sp.]|uniref:hypothetical protein n=1 Tax=uncultured Psychrobacter sp. TaxID=259303 RepID=UPI0034592E84
MSEDNENYGFLETHYYFTDDSHSMNAFVKNRCDRALLAIIEESSKELDITQSLKIEVLPISKGSLIEWHQFAVSPAGSVALLTLFINTLACILALKPPSYPESALDIENKNLDIKKKKLEIKLLEKKLSDAGEQDAKAIESIKEDVYDVLMNNFKIRKNLSIFYENIIEYEKVSAIGHATYGKNHKIILPEQKVDRSKFKDFILESNEFEEVDEYAKIIIYSPNLDKGRHKWRGLYEKEDRVIAFSMKDNAFKSDVESGVVTFKNGSTIRAVLTTKIKIDMTGAESSRSYTVKNVLRYSHDNGYTETNQGRTYKANKKDAEAQISFLFDN